MGKEFLGNKTKFPYNKLLFVCLWHERLYYNLTKLINYELQLKIALTSLPYILHPLPLYIDSLNPYSKEFDPPQTKSTIVHNQPMMIRKQYTSKCKYMGLVKRDLAKPLDFNSNSNDLIIVDGYTKC